jgi:glycosyltransferase involved in cell wall biosynthesis/radical SAM superfamily enzyme YgiQ (UPF0313 family)
MRIAFDGTTLRPGRTGVGYYSEHLLRHLAVTHPGDEVVVVSNQPIDTTEALESRVRVATSSIRVPRMVWMQMLAPRLLDRLAPDVAHFTNGMVPMLSRIATVVTIHDMSLTLYPRYHPPRRVLLNRPFVDLAARRADAIITVSESAKDDIVRLYKLAPDRVHVVHEAAAPSFRPVTDAGVLRRVREQYSLSERFILSVGSIEPRKNLPTLIEAFARRHKAGDLPHQLVCAGPYGWLSGDLDERIDRLRVSNAIRFTGYVPFEDLSALYSLAEMFVFPSIYEGFGLPIVEAMAAGTPVVTTRVGALAEVAGDAACYVDRLSADALGDAMVALAADPIRRHELRSRGLARARTFSWERAARETHGIYELAADARGARAKKGLRVAASTSSKPDAVSPRTPIVSRPTDVLFGQAYFLHFDPKLRDAEQPYPPLGTLYAAAVVRGHGFSVALFDAMLAQSTGEWSDALDRHRPRVAVLYEDSFNYLSKMCLLRMRDAAMTMIGTARERGIPVIVSGSDATDHASLYLDAGATRVILGEGEVTLAETIDSLLGRAPIPIDRIAGLASRGRDGQLAKTGPREIVRDLDGLPRPAWDLVDIDRYRSIWMRRHGYFSMNVVTTRGCPYHCNWCAKPIYGQRYGSRSPAHVVDEMKWLKDVYGPDHLWMADDIFGLKPGWIESFAALAHERDAVVPFKCLLRADGVTEPVASALAAAGCRTAWIGAESGSQRVLDAMEKGTTVEQIRTAAERLHRAGIEVGFFLQFGYPGETFDDIELTRQMVRDCRPDDIGISVSYPLPGTRFYDRVKAELGSKQNWVDSDDLAMMYRATYVPEFYRTLHSAVHAEFRARRALTTFGRALRHPLSVGRHHVREAVAGAYHALRLPGLGRRLHRLAGREQPKPPINITHVLSRHAAAVPSDPSSGFELDMHTREVEQTR